ncbi:hypothetical protein [Streptomyces sp. NBC_01373]|uniref:hypothetical protein n=1 Tax=unclassified Streptomyces TaxID=2593676 RepID=UPI0022592F36|nr:hypothetical protein [Streptomyces sp. NBC_01373]MCX4702715.1 hypothetical protein [Streptomyces sp. NBC_01373]
MAKMVTYLVLWRETEARLVDANGSTGALLYRDGQAIAFMTMAASKEGIHQLMWVFSPSKIAALLDSRSRLATVPENPGPAR